MAREEVNVVEAATMTQYWVRLKLPLTLSAGAHSFVVRASEPRRFDGRYFLNLDALFLQKTGVPRPKAEAVEFRFPMNPENRSVDNPFLSLAQYDLLIQSRPKDLNLLLETSKVESMLGNYADALKYLAKARLLDPENQAMLLETARNKIWVGENEEAYQVYRLFLDSQPQRADVWAEVAKIQAWQGKTVLALETYKKGLEANPQDLTLAVNQALTLYWAARVAEGDLALQAVRQRIVPTADLWAQVGSIFEVNGYPDKAAETYREAMAAFPDQLRFPLLAVETLTKDGKLEEAQVILQKISETFVPSDRLKAYLETATQRRSLKAKALEEIRLKLEASPEDIALREMYIDALFWNGRKEEAVQEHLNELVSFLSLAWNQLDVESAPLVNALNLLTAGEEALSKATVSLKQSTDRLAQAQKAETSATDPEAARESLQNAQIRWDEDLALRNQLLAQVAADLEATAPLVETAKADAALLAKLAAPLKWRWDRRGTLLELDSATKANLPLGPKLLERLTLLEAQTREVAKTASQGAEIEALVQRRKALRDGLKTKMLLMFFSYDESMASLRYQIGEELISVGNLPEGRRQLDKVLLQRPWDTRAQYRLGNVADMLGDWSDALAKYRRVYETDSRFPGAASLFNKLAKAHPETYEAQLRQAYDPGRQVRETSLSYRGDFNPWVGWRFDLGYSPSHLEGSPPRKLDITSVQAQFPLSWGFGQLLLVPSAGAFWDGGNQLVPAGSLELKWVPVPAVTLSAKGFQAPLGDTFDRREPIALGRGGEGSVTTYFALPPTSPLRSFSSRSYASWQTVSTDGNSLLTGVQELSLGLHLADAPWTTLQAVATAVGENSSFSAPGGRYYSPGGNVSLKPGLGLSTWLGLPASSTLGVSLRAAFGPYWQNLVTGIPANYLSGDATARLDWTKGDATLFAEATVSSTGQSLTAPSYWLLQGLAGFRLSLSPILAP